MTQPAPDAHLLRRLRWQLVAWSGLAVLGVLLPLGVALYFALSSSLAANAEARLRDRADELVQSITHSREPPERAPLGFRFGGDSAGSLALLIGPDNQVLGYDIALTPELQASVDAARAGRIDVRAAAVSVRDPGSDAIRSVPIRVVSQSADRLGLSYVVQVIQDRSAEEDTLGVFLWVLAVGALLALTLSLIAGAGYAGRALVPIRDALRRQREFAADASHELRTPLTIVRGNVELLRRRVPPDDAASSALLDDVDTEVTQLAALVDDLLLLARTDSGAVQLSATPLDLADVALDAMPSLSGLAEAKHVRLELEAAPAPIAGDAVRLRQLVTILVDNGVRHTPAGGRVSIRVWPDRDRVALDVEDDGPGVRPEDAPHVFDRFWRSPTAPVGGTGLGLAIAAWIVDRHRGTITVDRAPGRGARFSARFPVDRGTGSAARITADRVPGRG